MNIAKLYQLCLSSQKHLSFIDLLFKVCFIYFNSNLYYFFSSNFHFPFLIFTLGIRYDISSLIKGMIIWHFEARYHIFFFQWYIILYYKYCVLFPEVWGIYVLKLVLELSISPLSIFSHDRYYNTLVNSDTLGPLKSSCLLYHMSNVSVILSCVKYTIKSSANTVLSSGGHWNMQ